MSTTGESMTKSSSKGKSKAPEHVSQSNKAGLQFSFSRTKKFLRKGKYADRITEASPVYVAGVLEYLAGEVLDLASEVAKGEKKKIIKPRHISLAVQNDAELSKLFEGVTIPSSGGGTRIDNNILPNNNADLRGASNMYSMEI